MTDDQTIRGNRLVVAGGSGFLGNGLIRHLLVHFKDVVVLTRAPARVEGIVRYIQWDGQTVGTWANELSGSAALVNFVGRAVDCRKTPANKSAILSSRVNSVIALGTALQQCSSPPPVWIQSATAHIFGDTNDELLDETSPTGVGFAPDVGTAWEAALRANCPPSVRSVILRISFVLGRDGGPLKILSRLARLGLGGTVGSGKQYMSWIHEADLYRIIEHTIANHTMNGVYVTTAPDPVTNAEFMCTLRNVIHRPWSPRVPEKMVRLGAWLMRTDPELALLGRRCVPTRLLREGFVFQHPRLAESLADLLDADDVHAERCCK